MIIGRSVQYMTNNAIFAEEKNFTCHDGFAQKIGNRVQFVQNNLIINNKDTETVPSVVNDIIDTVRTI